MTHLVRIPRNIQVYMRMCLNIYDVNCDVIYFKTLMASRIYKKRIRPHKKIFLLVITRTDLFITSLRVNYLVIPRNDLVITIKDHVITS